MSYVINRAHYDRATHAVVWWATFTLSDGSTEQHGPHHLGGELPVTADGTPIEDYTPKARAALRQAARGDLAAIRDALHLDVQRVERELAARKAAPASHPVSRL
jgi:hypothetical protein